jgi:cytochrome P450
MERIHRMMQDHSDVLAPSPLAFAQSVMGSFLRYMDDETHSRYGRLFRRAMAGEATSEDAKFVGQLCDRELEGMSTAGPVSPIQPLQRMARGSLSRVLFGFDESGESSRRFDELATLFARASIGQAVRRSDRQMLREMERVLVGQLNDLEVSGRACGTNAPVLARLRQIDSAMPDRTCLDNLVFMHKIATANVSSLLLWLLYEWATQKDIVARIRDREGGDRLVALDAFLSETLRLNQSEYLYRKVAREFEFEEFRFPRGWMVRFCIWESHRTTDKLVHPDRFELRLGRDDYDREHFSPFGIGRHACNGVDVTKTICRIFLRSLAARYDVAVTHADPFQRRMRHWSHWQPNRKIIATLERRV